MSIAWLFPGQGSQKLGMAESLIAVPGAKERFKVASELLGRDLWKICNKAGSDPDQTNALDDTINTQPALFVVESLLIDDLKRQGREPLMVAGHSLGEIVALYAAEVFDMETALNLLKKRSELMAAAGGGAMAAVLGFERGQLDEIVESIEGVVIANDNSDSQVVLSGSPDAVSLAVSRLKCKRVVPLNVSGAFHSPFMENAAQLFSEELDKVSFKEASFPVLSNSDPVPTSDPELLKNKLKKQMTTGVRWRETMENIKKGGITNIVEIGPGNVLSGLAKRSLKGISINQISNANDLGY